MKKYKCCLTVLLVATITVLKAQVAKITIAYNGSHIFINVGLGSNDSLRFVFDTGATVV